MKIKVCDASGRVLDYMVALCESATDYKWPSYSADWSQGGPIIERHCINLFRLDPKTEGDDRFWIAHIDGGFSQYGVSALTAAMRCYVRSVLYCEVEVPEELNK